MIYALLIHIFVWPHPEYTLTNRKPEEKQVLNNCLFSKTSWKERKKINRWINGWVNK